MRRRRDPFAVSHPTYGAFADETLASAAGSMLEYAPMLLEWANRFVHVPADGEPPGRVAFGKHGCGEGAVRHAVPCLKPVADEGNLC